MDLKNLLKKCHLQGKNVDQNIYSDHIVRPDQMIVAKSSGVWFQPDVRRILLRKILIFLQVLDELADIVSH